MCAQAAPELIVKAGNSAALIADGQVSLLAAKNESSQSSTNNNSSSSVGVSYSVMTQSIGFNASASKGQGKSDGQDTSYTNTTIAAGNIATIKSGAGTTLKGAVVTANTIKADIGQKYGGSLSIQSLQDQSSYTSKQSSSGGSISVGVGAVTGGSISASKSNIDSTFKSVNQQSGLKAGDGGFQVTVANNTDLKGGAITSTQKALDSKANTFTTGGQLSTTDIQNTASYKGEASGISIDVGKQDGKYGVAGVGIGAGSDKGSAASTTAAGITGIAGNKAVRTGDKDTGLQKIFDQTKVQKKIDAEVAITQAFTKQAPKAAATFSETRAKELRKEGKEEEAKKWDEGGTYRIVVQTVVGALGGGTGGALGAGISAKAAPLLTEFQDSIAQKLEESGMSPSAAKLIASGITGLTVAGVGAVVGGVQGATYGAAVDFNNRQLHPTEMQWIKANAEKYAAQKGITSADAEKQLAQQAFRQVQFGVEGQTDTSAQAFLKTAGNQLLPGDPTIPGQNVGYMFYATPEQRANASMYLSASPSQADFYKQNGLTQPTAQALTLAAKKDADLRANLSTATKTALGTAAVISLGGLSPTLLQWALANPIAATQAGVISVETAAAIVSGAVTPSGLLQQISSPQAARVVYSRLAAAATQNADSAEIVLGRYVAGSASSY